jgi:hydrogenase maturation protein HypF
MHRLATALKLKGWVCNDGMGVMIHIEGSQAALAAFTRSLSAAIPPAARVEAIEEQAAGCEGVADFRIRASATTIAAPMLVRVPTDRALCADCRADVLDPTNRRSRHAFASCTLCGPRYSIIQEMPYERHHTSMERFPLCQICGTEYDDADNRRFHAEPIACPACGPRLKSSDLTAHADDCKSLTTAADALRSGRIVALKGLGGYQLLVRADDEGAVARLRLRKRRPSKPFAVMVRSIEEAARIAHISRVERDLLLAPENPIALLEARNAVVTVVAPGLSRIGVLLPTTPLHLLLLSQLDFPVVATSGNQSEEPIAIDEIGRDSLNTIADVFLDHDRPIIRRVDDSVIRTIDNRPMMIRLARGFAPCILPELERWAATSNTSIPPILALGGQQKTALAVWTGAQAILGQHLGDMNHPEARRAFACTAEDLPRLYGAEPKIYAGDLHPDYFTTQWAQSAGQPFVQVQHHHAHAVACMVENGLLGQDVLAVIFDGTGFGTDGTIWGGEILHSSMTQFQRLASLDLFALPGGEAAIREPNRIALSLLAGTFGTTGIPGWLLDRLGLPEGRSRSLLTMIERRVHSPQTSSVGRLFDAVAALLLKIREVSYEGEAALHLEDAVDPGEESAYPIRVHVDDSGVERGDWRPLIRCLLEDISSDVAVGVCAARFHNAIAGWSAVIAASSPYEDVVLGGGCFQNAHLTRRTRAAIEQLGKSVHVPSRIPANDGGLAVGQLAVAMARWRLQQTENNPCVSAFPADLSSAVS